MANPFRTLADLVEAILVKIDQSAKILTKLDTVAADVAEIRQFLGIDPQVGATDEQLAALDEKVRNIDNAVQEFKPGE